MPKRAITPAYLFFYLIFLPDFWQILIGIIVAVTLAPRAITPGSSLFSQVMMYVMIATIGYAASRPPARGIIGLLKKWILGNRQQP